MLSIVRKTTFPRLVFGTRLVSCNRDPASISTSYLDPRPVSGTRRICGTRLLEVLRYVILLIKYHSVNNQSSSTMFDVPCCFWQTHSWMTLSNLYSLQNWGLVCWEATFGVKSGVLCHSSSSALANAWCTGKQKSPAARQMSGSY